MSQTRVEHKSSLADHAIQSAERGRNHQKPVAQKPVVKAAALTHGRIAERAYALWQQKGCPTDQELATWLEAEAQLRREAGST